MRTFILPCGTCQASTIHRPQRITQGENGEQQPVVECVTCGTQRAGFAASLKEPTVSPTDTVRLLEKIPALSQRSACSKLEELLYEYRFSIEGSEVFCQAIAPVNAADFEMQDIKVESFEWDQRALVAKFTYYLLGARNDVQPHRSFRVDGQGSGRIDPEGRVEVLVATATVTDLR